MNKYMRIFLNYPEISGCKPNFVNRIQQSLINNSQKSGTDQETIHSSFTDEWEKLLDILRYRYALDVRADVAEILSDFKLLKTGTNFLEVLFKIVLKVDQHLDFHEYNGQIDGDSDDSDDEDDWFIPKLSELLKQIDCKTEQYLMNERSSAKLCYSYRELLRIRFSKLEYVIAQLCMIIENLLFCEEYTYPASDYFPSTFKKKKDPVMNRNRRKEQCTDSYFRTKLNQIAKNDFAILLTSPESVFPKYISERSKTARLSHRIPLKWTGGMDEVRLSAVASGESMLSGAYTNGGYTAEKYNDFFRNYHTYLNRILIRPKGKQLKNKKQEIFSSKYFKVNRLAAYYLSERIYGFNLIRYINEYIPVMRIEKDKCIAWMEIFAKLMRIPNIAIRAIYAEKLFWDENNQKMNANQLQVLSLSDVERMVEYETTVYYPILMIYALQCMEMICEKDQNSKIDLMLGLENAANNLKFRTPLRYKKEKLKELKIQEDLAVGVFYAELLNESYSLEYFETVFGTRCFDEKIEPRDFFRKMYHYGSKNGPADRETGQ